MFTGRRAEDRSGFSGLSATSCRREDRLPRVVYAIDVTLDDRFAARHLCAWHITRI
jgi:hypothetical protein